MKKAILERLDSLMEKRFGAAPRHRVFPAGSECARLALILRRLREGMDKHVPSRSERMSVPLLQALHQAVIVTDDVGTIVLFSAGAERMLGYTAEEIVGKQSPMLFHDFDEVRQRAEELSVEQGEPVAADARAMLVSAARFAGKADEREWTYVRKDGTRLTVLLSLTAFEDEQGMAYCGVATDVTERSRIAAEMSRLANYDPLTHLPNKRLFHDRMGVAIAQARRDRRNIGLLMIDLDRFKPVNDEYGHSVGDLLLCAVAGRMQRCLRESDTPARVGGDEFMVILPTIESVQDARYVANRMRRVLASPFNLTNDITVVIDSSIGVALYPEHGNDEDSLLKSADDAMYIAKGLGRAQVYVFQGAKKDEVLARVPGNHDTGRRFYSS